MTATANKIGINDTFKFDDMETAKGNYDVSKADTNQLAWSGVGQYNDAVNPMQMAIICGAIANGGKSTTPTYIKSGTGDLMKMIGLNKGESKEMFSPDTAQKLNDIMRYTITDYYGDDLFGNLSVCAKTGTGEVGEDRKPTAWMVGYAQDADCPLAFACVVEDAGFGFDYAGPVAQVAMKTAAESLRTKG